MLEITERAGAVLGATVRAAEGNRSSLRLSRAEPEMDGDGAGRRIRVDLVDGGALDDEVLEAPGGAVVLLDSQVVALLDDKVLDASTDDDGRTALVLFEQDPQTR